MCLPVTENEYQFRDIGMINVKLEEVYVGLVKQSQVYVDSVKQSRVRTQVW